MLTVTTNTQAIKQTNAWSDHDHTTSLTHDNTITQSSQAGGRARVEEQGEEVPVNCSSIFAGTLPVMTRLRRVLKGKQPSLI